MTGSDTTLPSLVCLSGVSGSGKDTLAAMLTDHHGFVRVAIADPLKRWVGDIFGLEHAQLWGDERDVTIERLGMSPRTLYQQFGAACVELDAEVLLRPWEREVTSLLADGQRVVCTDIRTPRELERAKTLGALTILITREGAGAPGDAAEHPTERWASEREGSFDLTHRNDAAIERSFEAIVEAMRRAS
jgi:hypothetical protein